MPRIPAGSGPPLQATRVVPFVQFDSSNAFDVAAAAFPLAPAGQYVSEFFDCFTSMYRGRGTDPTAIAYSEGWTRGLGEPGAGYPASSMYRAPAIFIDALCQAVRSVSIRFDFVAAFNIAGVPRVVSSYLWLPVRGSAGGLSPVPLGHLVQGLRVPAPWFRWVLTNEDLAANLTASEIDFHIWLRSQ